jgi:hypothetical protein
MKKIYLLSIAFLSQLGWAQTYQPGVGIAKDSPTRELDVAGTLTSKATNDPWYFENLGIYQGNTNDSYLTVIDKEDHTLKVFNPESMSYASINYATFRFNKLPKQGLEFYDTQIDADKYHVMIGGFIIYGGSNINASTVIGTDAKIDKNVLYSSRAYIQTRENGKRTWILKFQPNNGAVFSYNRVDLVLNVAIYRKNLLLMDTNDLIELDMQNTSVKTAPRPTGI